MKRILSTTLMALALLVGSQADAALNAYLALRLNGTSVPGEPTQTQVGGVNVANQIEVLSYTQESTTSATGVRQHGTIVIRKRMDRSSPSLYRALIRGEAVDGTFRFFTNDPDNGTAVVTQTVEITRGRILGIRQVSPNVLVAETGNLPFYEDVTISFSTITWTHVPTGGEATDSTSATR